VMDSNSVALKVGEYELDHMDWMESRIAKYVAGRAYLEKELADIGMLFVPSKANFIHVLFDSTDKANKVLAAAKNKGYLLKLQDFPPVEHSLRITVGPLSLMEKFWMDCRHLFS